MNRRRQQADASRKRRGFALVLVLMLSGVTALLAVAMLLSAKQETRGAEVVRARAQLDILEDVVGAVAVGQLRQATAGDTSTPAEARVWTSQPGAIRTYHSDGSPDRLYKLYSAARMAVPGGVVNPADDTPDDWASRPWDYVDLNAPVRVPDEGGATTRFAFPVVDPRAAGMPGGGVPAVEGFSIDAARIPTVGEGGASEIPSLPMPVRWLYVMDDGRLAATDENGLVADSGQVVGRIAFWTDDESCKVNVNTASEGVFWDVPRMSTQQDRALAEDPPKSGEFQRMPGHPATTSLSAVLLPGRRFGPDGDSGAMTPMERADLEALWSLAPVLHAAAAAGSAPEAEEVATAFDDSDRPRRLASVDALIHDARDRLAGLPRLGRPEFFLTHRSSAPETTLAGRPRIAIWPVHSSLDPFTGELLSPVAKATTYDRKVTLATNLGDGRRWFLTRSQAMDGFTDFSLTIGGRSPNVDLFEYLRRRTSEPVPGFGDRTFADKYGAARDQDRDAILVQILDYIRAANLNDGALAAESQFCVVCAGNEHVGFGQVSPLATVPFRRSPEEAMRRARGIGRIASISEVAFVFACRAEVDEDGTVRGNPSSGNRSRLTRPGERELEVGLVVETFVPSQGWGEYRPHLGLLLGGLPRGGTADPDPARMPTMKLCGQDLILDRRDSATWTTEDLPEGWNATGGLAGFRGFSRNMIRFQPVVVPPDQDSLSFTGTVDADDDKAGDRPDRLALALYDTPESAGSRAGAIDIVQTVPLSVPPIPEGGVPLPSLPDDSVALGLENRHRDAQRGQTFLSARDVVQSLVPVHGDHRLVAARRFVESRGAVGAEGTSASERPVFVAHPGWGERRFAHSLREPIATIEDAVLGEAREGGRNRWRDGSEDALVPGLRVDRFAAPDLAIKAWHPDESFKSVADGRVVDAASTDAIDWLRTDGGRRGAAEPWVTGDFDNGAGFAPDGPYVNRPDDGQVPLGGTEGRAIADADASGIPYFDVTAPEPGRLPQPRPGYFAPHRLLPSAVMFGSLPTGVQAGVPWQTLLFRPQTDHYGAREPADHLLLDHFWMPVAEPTPISRPFATEGKINLNHRIVPFDWVRRATALHALLKAEKMTAIPDSDSLLYKQDAGRFGNARYRRFIDAASTLAFWDAEVFDAGRTFLTESRICAMPLVPEGETMADRDAVAAFWKRHRLTGDNSRERPYAHLLPRLTTRSNTFRVHYVVQVLRGPRPASQTAHFDPHKAAVVAESRGSRLVERRIPVGATGLPDYMEDDAAPSLDRFHEWTLGPAGSATH